MVFFAETSTKVAINTLTKTKIAMSGGVADILLKIKKAIIAKTAAMITVEMFGDFIMDT
ncbi:hypothetical protein NBRC116592_34550 [Colwellia sp. KU-HH00111]